MHAKAVQQKALLQVEDWFHRRQWQPFAFQRQAWDAHLQGESGLIHAPTGIGKTYAAWFGAVAQALCRAPQERPGSPTDPAPPLHVLWITPLRALAADILAALSETVTAFRLPWTLASRTGDSSARVKRQQRERLPTVLITTPESLHLLLSYPGARQRFEALQLIVVDEWHELLGSKRGVQVELALARLRTWQTTVRIWGLSATLGNTGLAMAVLLGADAERGRLIAGQAPRDVRIEALFPDAVERFPWSGHLGLRLLPQVIETIEKAATTLVFTNTRSQTEIWFQALLEARPHWAGALALHHGSLARKERQTVEAGLGTGRYRAVVCTSSLDLGVDFAPVDQVVQIGSPKGIARLLQRAGRSGHQPGAISRLICAPTNLLELLEVAAARWAVQAGQIEPRRPVVLPLDVLAQYLVTLALGDGFRAPQLLTEVRRTYAFQTLSDDMYAWVLAFVSSGGASLKAYPDFHKLTRRGGIYTAANRRVAQRHRMQIGTITSDAAVLVKFRNGRRLGTVEERFVARLKPGDVFVFGGRLLQYVRLKEMTLFVKRASRQKGPIPQWLGGRMPLSTHLSAALRTQFDALKRGNHDTAESKALQPILDLQARWSILPGEGELLIEVWRSREGHHLFIFPFEGHLVHEGLGALLAYRLSRPTPLTLSIAVNDYGLELLSDQAIPTAPFADGTIFGEANLVDDILASLNAAEMGRRQFREIARVAGLVFPGYPGRPKSHAQVHASSSLLYNVFQRYEPDNLLLEQAKREVLAGQLAVDRLADCLRRMATARVRIMETGQATPLAFPILVNRLRTRVSSEKLVDRVKRMQVRLEKKADVASPPDQPVANGHTSD